MTFYLPSMYNLYFFVTGRQFSYASALQIMQEEFYLEDSDFDDIRRHDIINKVGKFGANFKSQIRLTRRMKREGIL